MKSQIVQSIRSLPPLPRTVEEFEKATSKEEIEFDKIVDILQQDPMLVADILKTVNSFYYGLKQEVEDLTKAISYLGLQEVKSIVLQHSIKKLFNIDMEPYGISADEFAKISKMQSKLTELWVKQLEPSKIKFLKLAAFLQELGKIVIADLIIKEDLTYLFRSEIEMSNDIASVERSFTGYSSAEVTGAMFEHWGFEEELVKAIRYADDFATAPESVRFNATVLHIVKRAIPVNKPLHESSEAIASNIAKEIGFDTLKLQKAIDELRFLTQ